MYQGNAAPPLRAQSTRGHWQNMPGARDCVLGLPTKPTGWSVWPEGPVSSRGLRDYAATPSLLNPRLPHPFHLQPHSLAHSKPSRTILPLLQKGRRKKANNMIRVGGWGGVRPHLENPKIIHVQIKVEEPSGVKSSRLEMEHQSQLHLLSSCVTWLRHFIS